MQSKIFVMVRHPSVCLFHCLTAAVACGGVAAESRALWAGHSLRVAGAQWQRQHSMMFSSKCGQCHVDS